MNKTITADNNLSIPKQQQEKKDFSFIQQIYKIVDLKHQSQTEKSKKQSQLANEWKIKYWEIYPYPLEQLTNENNKLKIIMLLRFMKVYARSQRDKAQFDLIIDSVKQQIQKKQSIKQTKSFTQNKIAQSKQQKKVNKQSKQINKTDSNPKIQVKKPLNKQQNAQTKKKSKQLKKSKSLTMFKSLQHIYNTSYYMGQRFFNYFRQHKKKNFRQGSQSNLKSDESQYLIKEE